jgi:hypothetical protein
VKPGACLLQQSLRETQAARQAQRSKAVVVENHVGQHDHARLVHQGLASANKLHSVAQTQICLKQTNCILLLKLKFALFQVHQGLTAANKLHSVASSQFLLTSESHK